MEGDQIRINKWLTPLSWLYEAGTEGRNALFDAGILKSRSFRIPIINGFNNDPSGFAAYFSKFATDKLRFELLPYHEYGKEKWKHPYLVQDGFISADDQRAFRQIFEAHGLCLVTS